MIAMMGTTPLISRAPVQRREGGQHEAHTVTTRKGVNRTPRVRAPDFLWASKSQKLISLRAASLFSDGVPEVVTRDCIYHCRDPLVRFCCVTVLCLTNIVCGLLLQFKQICIVGKRRFQLKPCVAGIALATLRWPIYSKC
jgi:hypothetical protein